MGGQLRGPRSYLGDRVVSDLSTVRVGDILWSTEYGRVEVIERGLDWFQFERGSNKGGNMVRDLQGCNPVFPGRDADTFWEKPGIIVPPPPVRKIKRTKDIWVVLYKGDLDQPYAFAYTKEQNALRDMRTSGDALAKEPVKVTIEYEE